MREILFKAKRIDNGEWVYGYLVKVVCATGSEWHINENAKDPDDYHKIYTVDSETVCQFTGLCDKNSKKIYEGDILEAGKEYTELYGHPVIKIGEFCDSETEEENLLGTYFEFDDGSACNISTFTINTYTVLGNIYDRSEGENA